MPKTDKREEIVKTSLELITEHGFHGAPMAMIAERSGVAVGTIYRYFESKDMLIKELFRELEDRIYAVAMDGYSVNNTVRERFLHLGAHILRFCIANPLEFRYLEQFHNSPYGVVHRRDKILGKRDAKNIYCELFEEGIKQQVVKELPMVVLFDLALGPLIAVARDHILGFVMLDDVLITRTIEACWDGVKL
jgi:AcrR family transcriptional regulator